MYLWVFLYNAQQIINTVMFFLALFTFEEIVQNNSNNDMQNSLKFPKTTIKTLGI